MLDTTKNNRKENHMRKLVTIKTIDTKAPNKDTKARSTVAAKPAGTPVAANTPENGVSSFSPSSSTVPSSVLWQDSSVAVRESAPYQQNGSSTDPSQYRRNLC